MAEKLTTLPHDFDFIEDERSNLTFVGSIRLDPSTNLVMLKADTNGNYPTTGDNYVISKTFNPQAVRQWVGFQSFVQNVMQTPTIQLTGDLYRLYDGVNQWWWDPVGLAWVQTTTQWSPESDIANHISTFPATTRTLGVVVKLTTTDATVTPSINLVRVAWTGKINTFEDVLYRSLVPLLKTTRIIVDFNIKVPMPGGSQLDVLTPVKKANNKFNVVDVESVFNNNLDPDCYNNLLSSYNSVTGIATLSTAVPVGQIAYCRLVLQPQVAVKNTSMDFIEAELAPSIQLTDIMSVETQPTAHEIGVTNKATKAVLRVQPPYRFNLRFTMIALAPGGVDLTRTLEALVELMEENPLLTSAATGEQYRLWLIEEFQDTTQPNDMNLHSMQATFEVLNILTFKKPTVSEVAVGTLNLNTSNG